MNRAGIAGVILAAGASSRMGEPKALLEYQGETFLHRLAITMAQVCGRVVVVLGYTADLVRTAVPPGAETTVNPAPERGMLSSLQCGLRAVGDSQAVLFLPVDYAGLRSETLTRIADEAGTAEIVVPVFEERHGHPVCISRAIVAELLALPSNAQARDVIRRHRGSTRYIVVDDAGVVNDVDTPEDYRALVEAGR